MSQKRNPSNEFPQQQIQQSCLSALALGRLTWECGAKAETWCTAWLPKWVHCDKFVLSKTPCVAATKNEALQQEKLGLLPATNPPNNKSCGFVCHPQRQKPQDFTTRLGFFGSPTQDPKLGLSRCLTPKAQPVLPNSAFLDQSDLVSQRGTQLLRSQACRAKNPQVRPSSF